MPGPSSSNVVTQTWRLAPTVVVIIAINLGVFLLWQNAERESRLEAFLFENFLVSTVHVREGHVWTLVTSAFSHSQLWHLVLNMFVLWNFGLLLEQLWKPRVFLTFYLIASVAGSASHCLTSTYLVGNSAIPALGASGAVSGLLMAFALHFPRSKILLFALVPIPALVGVLAFAGLDVWGLIEQTQGGGVPIGHGAHLGGTLAGALLWVFYLRQHFTPRETRLDPAEASELNRIGAKLREHGPASLTPEEAAFVERVRGRR